MLFINNLLVLCAFLSVPYHYSLFMQDGFQYCPSQIRPMFDSWESVSSSPPHAGHQFKVLVGKEAGWCGSGDEKYPQCFFWESNPCHLIYFSVVTVDRILFHFTVLKSFGVAVKTNNYSVSTITDLYHTLNAMQTAKIICLEISMFSLYGIKGYKYLYLELHLYTHEIIASC
jgi:hypothetical protein